jgi:hypothetical protein
MKKCLKFMSYLTKFPFSRLILIDGPNTNLTKIRPMRIELLRSDKHEEVHSHLLQRFTPLVLLREK